MADTEPLLVQLIRKGDAQAFSDLMRSYYDTVSAVAYHILRSRDEAKDVAQEVFTRIWYNRDTLDPSKSIRAFLIRTAHNHALNLIKHDNVRARYQESVITTTGIDDSGSAPGVDDIVIDDAEFEAMLSSLNERHQLALRLRYSEDMSYGDLGAAFGISDKAAEQLVIRAVTALRKKMVGQGP